MTSSGVSASGRGVPCPLLGPDGSCSIYEERPIVCRTIFQLDLSADCSEVTLLAGSGELLAWGREQQSVYLIEGLQAWRRCQPAQRAT